MLSLLSSLEEGEDDDEDGNSLLREFLLFFQAMETLQACTLAVKVGKISSVHVLSKLALKLAFMLGESEKTLSLHSTLEEESDDEDEDKVVTKSFKDGKGFDSVFQAVFAVPFALDFADFLRKFVVEKTSNGQESKGEIHADFTNDKVVLQPGSARLRSNDFFVTVVDDDGSSWQGKKGFLLVSQSMEIFTQALKHAANIWSFQLPRMALVKERGKKMQKLIQGSDFSSSGKAESGCSKLTSKSKVCSTNIKASPSSKQVDEVLEARRLFQVQDVLVEDVLGLFFIEDVLKESSHLSKIISVIMAMSYNGGSYENVARLLWKIDELTGGLNSMSKMMKEVRQNTCSGDDFSIVLSLEDNACLCTYGPAVHAWCVRFTPCVLLGAAGFFLLWCNTFEVRRKERFHSPEAFMLVSFNTHHVLMVRIALSTMLELCSLDITQRSMASPKMSDHPMFHDSQSAELKEKAEKSLKSFLGRCSSMAEECNHVVSLLDFQPDIIQCKDNPPDINAKLSPRLRKAYFLDSPPADFMEKRAYSLLDVVLHEDPLVHEHLLLIAVHFSNFSSRKSEVTLLQIYILTRACNSDVFYTSKASIGPSVHAIASMDHSQFQRLQRQLQQDAHPTAHLMCPKISVFTSCDYDVKGFWSFSYVDLSFD